MPEQGTKEADYSGTVNLPRTGFPMKGDLPKTEPERLKFWDELGLYERLQERYKARGKSFVLHDGPPYANAHIHIGTSLNKILKDMVIKCRSLLGYRTPYIPGWDCHGLPIESALLKELKMSKRGIKDIAAFRAQAEQFAERWIGIQRDEFRRLGVVGDWKSPYKTMSRRFEARVLRAFRLLLKEGYVYRGEKPVFWCITCETALAEAEIEYKEKSSPSVYVAMPVQQPADFSDQGVEVLVWTTTPWTLPANMAAAFHPELEYVVVSACRDDWPKPRLLLLAESRRETVMTALGVKSHSVLKSFRGKDLAPANPQRRHLRSFHYERPYGVTPGIGVLAEYVTAEDGTGVVHTAPGHGADDFHTGLRYGLEPLNPVDNAGRFTEKAGALAGKQIFTEGNPAIVADLKARGWLLGEASVTHSYPHCWRCKNPIIFRTTEQWFLNVAFEGLRERLLRAVGKVRWIPEVGQTRIASMVEGRPDWCLSRQRVWGTPIPVLFCVGCKAPLKDDRALEAIERQVEKEGDSFWFSDWGAPVTPSSWPFLPKDARCAGCGKAEFRREEDILDVWVDSGASWLAVLEPRGELPCDLYLEGSDQHRGWFQSSLVLSVALTGSAPYKSVLTHGFVLDERGRAMHKSAGNVVAPEEVVSKFGADVLRLWVALADYSDDVRISDKILEGPAESYRKLRNTVRYLLGNTSDFDPRKDAVPYERLPDMEKFVLHRLARLQRQVVADYERYQFRAATRALIDFCNLDLSSFYLDVLKDRLYTFPAGDPARRAGQTVMAQCLERLLLLCAPVLSFTAEEAWQHGPRRWGGAESVFLADLGEPATWEAPALAERWEGVLAVRAAVQKALEEARGAKTIGGSLQAKVALSGAVANLRGVSWPELLLVSECELKPGPGELSVSVLKAPGRKCARCWRYQQDVGSSPAHPQLCARCAGHLGK